MPDVLVRRKSGRMIVAAIGMAIAVDAACATTLLLLARSCCAGRLDVVTDNQLVVLFYGADPTDVTLRLAEMQRVMNLHPDVQGFCVGGARPARGVFHCSSIIAQLVASGIRSTRLTADTHSSDTAGNVEAAFAAAGAREPIFVSDPLHLMRLRSLAARIAPGRRYRTSATKQPAGLHLIWRLHWEIGAYISQILPKEVRRMLLTATRG